VALFSKLFGRTVSEGAAFAVGTAVGPTLRPVVQDLANESWRTHPVRPLSAGDAAAIVAEDVEHAPWGRDEAELSGVDNSRFDALVGEALNAPGLSELFEAWRRNLIDDASFTHGLRKAKLEPEWDAPLQGLKQRLLSLSDLANARQQGFVSEGRQRSESDLQGVDKERADILFELSGLPLGVETMQQALNRGLTDEATFRQAIREGHTKTKYTDLALALRVPVLHATDYAGLHLRGWITEPQMNAGGALSGYSAEQMDLLFLNRGRPAAPGQMATAAARGIDGPDGRPMDKTQFLKGIAESDIRPEWGPMLWESRYLYPPLFQITRLVQAGVIDAATAREWAVKDRYPPEVVAPLFAYWSAPSAAKADTHIGKAQTQLWTTTHRSFLAGESDDATATAALAAAGVPTDAAAAVLELWRHEQDLIRKQLTPAQVKKAYLKVVTNPATGAAWTLDDATAALLARGYSLADATTYLAE
jgi:hypothetical protein